MTELSPAAEAVLNSVTLKRYDVPYYACLKSIGQIKSDVAAALRAVADQVAPDDVVEPRNYLPMAMECQRIRQELLAIAAELEGIRVLMPEDFELIQFTEDWWRGYSVYEGEEGRAYVTHVFNHISKEHLVDFLRDAINEFNQKE